MTLGHRYKKIRNIQIVDTYALTVQCEFQRVRITGVPLARCQTSKNATWSQVTSCDLVTWPLGSSGHRFFWNVSNCWLNSYGKFGGAVFSLTGKNRTGGWNQPPVGARVNNYTLKESHTWLLVCTRHCYFISFHHEQPVSILPILYYLYHLYLYHILTRAPLGYFYNAPHWEGGLFRAPPPVISETTEPILKIK